MRPSTPIAPNTTHRFLRALGITCATGFLLCGVIVLLMLLLPERPATSAVLQWTGIAAIVFLFVPSGAMAVHLAICRELTEREKLRWERLEAWGLLGLIPAFFYLIRKDKRLPKRGAL